MTVKFDEFSRDVPEGDQPGDALPAPARAGRKRIAIASAGGAVLLTGAVVAALVTTSGSASASSAALAAASSAASSSSAAKPAPKGTDDHRGGQLGAVAGKPILFGTVKSVSGSKILITDLQGFTRTIITSSTTTYKDGLSANPAAGTKLIAMGTIAVNGTDLDAAAISGLPAGLSGPGGGHPGFPDFRGGPGGSGGPAGSGGSGKPFPHPTGTPPSGFHPGGRLKPTGTPTATKTV